MHLSPFSSVFERVGANISRLLARVVCMVPMGAEVVASIRLDDSL